MIRFANDYDKRFLSTDWSFADEVIDRCLNVIKRIEGRILPSRDWFIRRGAYKKRVIYGWEPETWGNLLKKMDKLGGICHIRKLLGQEKANRVMWKREDLIQTIAAFFSIHQKWPNQIKFELSKKETLTPSEVGLKHRCKNLTEAVTKHIGNAAKMYEMVIPCISHDIRPDIPQKKYPKGVKSDGHGKYLARIIIDKKQINLGVFTSASHASISFEQALKRKKKGLAVK